MRVAGPKMTAITLSRQDWLGLNLNYRDKLDSSVMDLMVTGVPGGSDGDEPFTLALNPDQTARIKQLIRAGKLTEKEKAKPVKLTAAQKYERDNARKARLQATNDALFGPE